MIIKIILIRNIIKAQYPIDSGSKTVLTGAAAGICGRACFYAWLSTAFSLPPSGRSLRLSSGLPASTSLPASVIISP